jgi:hypothetical protein
MPQEESCACKLHGFLLRQRVLVAGRPTRGGVAFGPSDCRKCVGRVVGINGTGNRVRDVPSFTYFVFLRAKVLAKQRAACNFSSEAANRW